MYMQYILKQRLSYIWRLIAGVDEPPQHLSMYTSVEASRELGSG